MKDTLKIIVSKGRKSKSIIIDLDEDLDVKVYNNRR